MLLHNSEELNDNLGGGSEENLSLSGLLGVHDGLESGGEGGLSNHFL